MKRATSRRKDSILARLACLAALVGLTAYAAPIQVGRPVGPGSGTLPRLTFAIVGDCRPANKDDVAAYPTAIISKIWQDIEAATPRPAFAITTGNYMFADPAHTPGTQNAQLAAYLAARANFTNIVFPAMGTDECTGAPDSNCGPRNRDGVTANYSAFLSKMLTPIGKKRPFYMTEIDAANGSWTAKFVFVASNAWSRVQAAWLEMALETPSTYTFVVMNSPASDTSAPCLSATTVDNAASIINRYPYTLLIAGHDHTYAYYGSTKEIVVGNGGAPLSGSVNYGYVIARQKANGSIVFTEYDYSTNAPSASFTVR